MLKRLSLSRTFAWNIFIIYVNTITPVTKHNEKAPANCRGNLICFSLGDTCSRPPAFDSW